MTESFLQKKIVPIDGKEVEITQLSGLERFDFMDYCSNQEQPVKPIKPAAGATEEEQEKYLEELNKYTQKWYRISFVVSARLVAYGYRAGVESIDERHNQIMSIMTPEQVTQMHDEIARFSGLPVPGDESETATSENTSSETTTTTDSATQEPTDPKV